MNPPTRHWRFAVPAVVAWGALAIVVTVMRELDGSAQWWVAATGFVIGGLAVVVGLGPGPVFVVAPTLRARLRVRDGLILGGLMLMAFLISLSAQMPLADPKYSSNVAFDIPWATDVRAHLVDTARTLPGSGNQLVPGLAVGDTTLVSDSLNADMKAVSLTHLVAVSGANCAVITAGVVAVVALCGGGRWIRTLAASASLALFVAIVGPQPSVIRASVMAVILLVSLSSGSPTRGVPLLALAVVALLLVDPTWSVNIGFTLSVLATGALLLLARPLEERLAIWMPRRLAAVIAVPLAAELVCQPVIATLTPGLPGFGIVANVLAAPAAPIATVAGLVAALVLPISQPVGTFLLWLEWLPAQWISRVASVTAHLPYARLFWPGGVLGVAASIVLSLSVVGVLLAPRARRLSAFFLVLTLGVSTTSTVVTGALRHVGRPNDWVIAACDIGQGDALLLRPSSTTTHTMLIDTGRDADKLRTCLDELGIDRIELLVLTHYDQDHVGAYEVVLGRVDHAIVGKPVDVSEMALSRDLELNGATVEYGHAGLRGDLGSAGVGEPAFLWRELWPVVGHPDMQSGNPGSLVIRADWAGEHPFSALFLGDLGEDAQRALLSSTSIRPATVVKVAHHGSADQYDKLYGRVHARLGLVSVGADNGYGHPTNRALSILAASGTAVERTDTHGMVLVRQTDLGLEVWTER